MYINKIHKQQNRCIKSLYFKLKLCIFHVLRRDNKYDFDLRIRFVDIRVTNGRGMKVYIREIKT